MSPRTHLDREQCSGVAYRHALMFALVMLITIACQPLNPPTGFNASNLLALDPSDTDAASTDMLAVYSYQTAQTLSLRIDLLDFNSNSAPALTLLLDTFPGASVLAPLGSTPDDNWDVSLTIHPDGSLRFETGRNVAFPTESVSVAYDPVLDTVTIRLPLDVIEPPGPFELIIFSMQHLEDEPADTIGPIRSDAPPPKPIPVLLAFWNTFPSATPAQALRSWDGAHNGPAGERFGLRHLLTAVEAYGIPVVLVDLQQPMNLVGLQLLGASTWINDLAQRSLLSLPETLPEALCEQASALSWPEVILTQMNDDSSRMGLPASTALACHSDDHRASHLQIPPGYRYLFAPEISLSAAYQPKGQETGTAGLIPLQSEPSAFTKSTDAGLSLDLRKQIAATLGTEFRTNVLVLSADFQNSFWGDPRSVDESMRWIAGHPWIQPVSLEVLARSKHVAFVSAQQPDEDSKPSAPAPLPTSNLSLKALLTLFDNTTSDGLQRFAWEQIYYAYALPSCEQLTSALELERESIEDCEHQQKQARRALNLLAEVMAWDRELGSKADQDAFPSLNKTPDDDMDGIFYANDNWLAILDPERNQLEALLINHPLKGPIPVVWDPAVKAAEDQTTLPIQLELPQLNAPLKIEFKTDATRGTIQIPLYLPTYLLAPEKPVSHTEIATTGICLIFGNTPLWQIHLMSPTWTYDSIFDTPARWDIVEDPNQEMPAGHFLPIPFGRFTIEYVEPFYIHIQIPD